MLQTMSLGSIVLLTAVWLAMSKVLTCESLRNSGSHRGRHKYKRRQLYSGGNNDNVHLHQDDSPLQHDPSLLLMDDDNEAVTADATSELDKPRECIFYNIYIKQTKMFYFFIIKINVFHAATVI